MRSYCSGMPYHWKTSGLRRSFPLEFPASHDPAAKVSDGQSLILRCQPPWPWEIGPVDMSFFCRFVAIFPWLDDFPFIFPKNMNLLTCIYTLYKFTIDVYRISFCHGNSCFMITTHWAHGQHQGAQFGPNPGYRDDDQAGIRRQKSI